jgi:hypothetical protein
MPNLITAYVIYNGTTGIYVGNDLSPVMITINCERLQAFSPRQVWLKRFMAPGDGTVILYEPTFNPTSDELLDTNIIPGYWIEQDNQDVMVDVTTLNAFQSACDACCGTVPNVVASNYNGTPPQFTAPTLTSLCIYRADDGSAGAHDAFAAAYVGLFVGTAVMRSNFSFLSHYTITTYYTSAQFASYLQGSDTIGQSVACSS